MSESPFNRLNYGYTLLTPQTKKWTNKQFAENDRIESAMIFDNFSAIDQGKSRVLICKMETSDQRWVSWRDYIIEAVNAKETLEQQLAEAKAEIEQLSRMLSNLLQLLPDLPKPQAESEGD